MSGLDLEMLTLFICVDEYTLLLSFESYTSSVHTQL